MGPVVKVTNPVVKAISPVLKASSPLLKQKPGGIYNNTIDVLLKLSRE